MAGKKLTFEESMDRLEEIVSKLEDQSIPLEESIKLYEEGIKLGKKCRKILDEAEQRIKELSSEEIQNNPEGGGDED
jgi:exodeoxyribonuclease VII small subunit